MANSSVCVLQFHAHNTTKFLLLGAGDRELNGRLEAVQQGPDVGLNGRLKVVQQGPRV